MPSRRDVLARTAGGLVILAALAGCSVLDGMPDGVTIAVGEPDETPTATATPAESTPPTYERPSHQMLRYRDLSAPERRLVEKALDGGYRTCDEVPEAANALADRIRTPDTYLRYRGEVKGLWLAITDMVFAGTTDPPAGECGLF
ncbi:hypothetical protein [Halorarius litoreus]|uniref:hypothetical protein n=1 Tax=Halorarius litoreus TaxID=2962676 RepID=UPI0020CC790F|nr:hypothetical protein [Halorarius litoreus]